MRLDCRQWLSPHAGIRWPLMRRPSPAWRGPSSRRQRRPRSAGVGVKLRGDSPAQGLPVLDPSAGAAAARARSPAWPPHRRTAGAARRPRIAADVPSPARRPARGPAAAPSSPRPLGRRGHAPPPATRVTLASRAPRPAPSPPHAFTRPAPPGASPGLRQAHRARRRAGRGSHCRLCTRGVSWSDDAPHPPPAPPRRASTRRRPPAPPRRCCRWDCVARASRRGHPPP